MRALTIVLSALSLMFAAAATASAQDASESTPRVETFGDDLVTGSIEGPWAETLRWMRRGPRTTLIRARGTYLPELLVSVEDL